MTITVDSEKTRSQANSAATDHSPAPATLEQHLHHCIKDYLANEFVHGTQKLHQLMLKEVESTLLRLVMEHTNNNRTQSANILGISRSTLRSKLIHYSIDVD